jgi:4-amino-4-deoxy-L-arabinose transferase-like glycosyltransferase
MSRVPNRDRGEAVHLKLLLSAALIGYFLLATGSIFTRLPWVDEGIFASPAYNLVSKGYMGTAAMETAGTPWQGIERHTYWIVPLHLLAQAGWYELFGFGLFSMRTLSALWGLAALAALYTVVLRLSRDRAVAALAAALIALDCSFIATASSGRMDMMNAALGMAGLATYLCLREQHLPIAVLAGHSLVCASGLTHPNGILYFASLLFGASRGAIGRSRRCLMA